MPGRIGVCGTIGGRLELKSGKINKIKEWNLIEKTGTKVPVFLYHREENPQYLYRQQETLLNNCF